MPKHKDPQRICVLVGRQQWDPFIGACRSVAHGHISGERADKLVDDGSAERLRSAVRDRHGKVKVSGTGEERMKTEPAIRLVKAKRWKGVLSDRGSGAPMKCMQLVSN